MAIIFDESKRLFHLTTPNTSYVLAFFDDYLLLHLYYGKRLENINGIEETLDIHNTGVGFSAINCEADKSEGGYTSDALPQEYAFYGSSDMRKPSFHAVYEDGSRITKPKYLTHRIFSSKPRLSGLPSTYTEADTEADTLEIEMKDELTGLILMYRYTAFSEYDAIARSVTVKNSGSGSINIKEILSCNIDFLSCDYDFIHLCGAWARERHIERASLAHGTIQIESRRGSSSHHHSPFFALAEKNTDEEHGRVYGFSLVYSGNFEAGVEVDSFNNARAYMGINSFDFNWLLAPGEELTAPEAVMVFSDRGIGEMSRTYHRLYRKRLARGKFRDAERPVLINNWEATYFDFDEEKLVQIAKTAKRAGIELMVLDDGWFGKRDSDNCSLGDWYPDLRKLPDGIEGIARKVEECGMRFGLWFEPEMVSPDSDLYREHPDWCLHVKGRGRSECRNQLILDLSRSDVCDYIYDTLSEILRKNPIAYVKWDMNRNMTEVGSALLPPERQSETAHRYILGLYSVLEKLTSEFPEVLFEGCSGGGGRFDAGMMHYFSQYWTSDDTDAVERLYIQHGTSLVMPAAFMGAHVSAVPNHQVGRVTPLKMRGDVAMCGQLGYELDVTKMTEDELAEIAEQISNYKEIRQIIHNGDMYRAESPFEGNGAVWEFVSEDKSTAVVFTFTAHGMPNCGKRNVRLPGICEAAEYRLRSTGKIYSGAVLASIGISVCDNEDCRSEVLIFDRI